MHLHLRYLSGPKYVLHHDNESSHKELLAIIRRRSIVKDPMAPTE